MHVTTVKVVISIRKCQIQIREVNVKISRSR